MLALVATHPILEASILDSADSTEQQMESSSRGRPELRSAFEQVAPQWSEAAAEGPVQVVSAVSDRFVAVLLRALSVWGV